MNSSIDAAHSILSLHHVQLAIPAGGEDACREFWGGIIGLQELPKPPILAARGGCWFKAGAVEVHCGVEASFVPARKAHPGFVVADVDALAARLAAHHVDVTWDESIPGTRRFHAFDPHGNRLEFMATPA